MDQFDVQSRAPNAAQQRANGQPDNATNATRTVTTPLRSLDAVFRPSSVAVIGASERPGSVGRTVMSNLLANPFGGCVYPINARRKSVLGVPAYHDIGSLPEIVDLAVIITPAATVPEIVQQCGDRGVPAAIIISAEFKELGPAGEELERAIQTTARQRGMRIVGPNCLGVMSPLSGLNATFAGAMAHRGRIAFLSQSGALCTAILDWSLQANVGFSAFVSLGSMLDVGWGDLIDYFGRDPQTDSILLYMETVGDARSFLSAARDVAMNKPIICIKGGRTDEASKAAASHTGSLAGSDMAFDAAVRRVGLLRVDRVADLFSMAAVLSQQPRPKGRRLTIVTNAGGPGVLATDALVQGGGKLTELSSETRQKLDELLPPHWSRNNPIDVLGDADAERYAQTLEVAANDSNSDGLLVVLTPQDMTDPLRTAEALKPLARIIDKPVLASWMGGESVEAGVRVLNEASIPNFHYPDTAARAFNYLARYNEVLQNLYETPSLMSDDEEAAQRTAAAGEIIASARAAGRSLLTEEESKRLLAAYGIPVVPTHVAASETEAVQLAERIGFPVVLKLHSLTITHKTDIGGVHLNLSSAADVEAAFRRIQADVTEKCGAEHFQGATVQPMIVGGGYELIVGSKVDPQFGPVMLFGTGGQLVEIYRDTTAALPPLNATLARRMMERTKIFRALLGTRGRRPVDLLQLERTLVAFSNLLMEQPWIKECDINPLWASPDNIWALDARVLLYDATTSEQEIVRPAIRPYPAHYVRKAKLKDETAVTLRPIRLEDEPLMVQFHETLSDESVRRRFFQVLKLSQRIEHQRLIRVCFNDYDRDVALVAEKKSPDDSAGEILGVARLSRDRGSNRAEFSIIVSDHWQRRGLGQLLLEQLIKIGTHEGVQRIVGHILPDNWGMQALCKNLGFQVRHDGVNDEVRATLDTRPETDDREITW